MFYFLLLVLCLVFVLPAGAAQTAAQAEWEKVLQAARREGQVVIYGAPGEESLYQQFEGRHPGIKVVYIPGGGERVSRILSERRAGKFLADLYIGGKEPLYSGLYKVGVLDPIRDMLMVPEVVDESKWFGRSHLYSDDDRRYLFTFNQVVQHYFQYNTKAVDPNQFTSYWDLLDPKWKGKILLWEPLQAGTDGALRFLYYNPELGPKFITRLLTEMQAVETREGRLYVDWLASGRFAITGLQSPDRPGLFKAKEQGLPVDWFDSRRFKEGAPLSPGSGHIALLGKAAHPNAAKVFVNWFLSREGQIIYQTMDRQTGAVRNSLRTDVPKQDVPAHAKPVDGGKYLRLTDREVSDATPVVALVKQLRSKN